LLGRRRCSLTELTEQINDLTVQRCLGRRVAERAEFRSIEPQTPT
jgi:hypothetical protein